MAEQSRRSYWLVALIALIFFVISFLTNILGPIIPDIIQSFGLSLTLASFLPFSFFVAYGLLSIPSGMAVERWGEKPLLVFAFALALAGSLAFAVLQNYPAALASLFVIGAGMAVLQVAINPLLRTAGGEEHYAFNMVMMQLVFGLASFLSPKLYTYLVTNLGAGAQQPNAFLDLLRRLTPVQMEWISVYWIFAAVSAAMLALALLLRLPRVELAESERIGAWETPRRLLRKRIVILYFIGIFCYVGTEQGIANWTSKFLAVYHGLDPQREGAAAVSHFWGLMTVGTVVGLALLKLFDSRRVLIGFSLAALACYTVALTGTAETASLALPLMGFFISSMWSIIFSLALNSVEKYHGAFSGILCTAIAGGAVVPVIIGSLGDLFGLRAGLAFLYATLLYILGIGFWARPLVVNETIWRRRAATRAGKTREGPA